MTADEIIEKLDMEEHYEGGYYKFIWKSSQIIPKDFLPNDYQNHRKLASVIYYLLKPNQTSCWHKLKSDEYWFWHYGGTLEMTLGGNDISPKEEKKIQIGSNLFQNEMFQAYVPAGTWQTTKPIGNEFVLVSCVVSPGFEIEDFLLP